MITRSISTAFSLLLALCRVALCRVALCRVAVCRVAVCSVAVCSVVLCSVVLCSVVGCSGESRSKTSPSTANEPVVLVASADTSGWIVPCGCTSNQSGGLLRRASYLRQVAKKQQLVYVDAGGAIEGNTPYEVENFRAIAMGEMGMKIAAHNIGKGELTLGQNLLDIAKTTRLPLVSANVVDGDNKHVVPTTRRIEVGDMSLLITGVVSQTLASADSRWHVLPPRDTILSAIERSQKPGDQLVVLAYVPQIELVELARSLPEIHLFIGGPTGQSMSPQQHGPTVVAAVTNKGKFLAEMQLDTKSTTPSWSGKIVELTEQFPDDAAQVDNLKLLYQAFGRRDFAPSDTPFALPAQFPPSYAVGGKSACVSCHEDANHQWSQSAHHHAWKSLQQTGAHVDAACQRCHTTGYGYPNGFKSIADAGELANVGCESCHGPSKQHAESPDIPTGFRGQAKSRCVRCHDRENSPNFDAETYWEQVVH